MLSFAGVHARLAHAMHRAENPKPVLAQFGSTLSVPQFHEFQYQHSPAQEVRPKLERPESGEGYYYSAPSSPFLISEAIPTAFSSPSPRHLLPQPPQLPQHYAYGAPPQPHYAYCQPPLPLGYQHGQQPYQMATAPNFPFGPSMTFPGYSSLLPTPPEVLR
jgi:hypothetical protein